MSFWFKRVLEQVLNTKQKPEVDIGTMELSFFSSNYCLLELLNSGISLLGPKQQIHFLSRYLFF